MTRNLFVKKFWLVKRCSTDLLSVKNNFLGLFAFSIINDKKWEWKLICICIGQNLGLTFHKKLELQTICLCFNALGSSKVSESTWIVGICWICDQNGDGMTNNDKISHICSTRVKVLFSKISKIWDCVYILKGSDVSKNLGNFVSLLFMFICGSHKSTRLYGEALIVLLLSWPETKWK